MSPEVLARLFRLDCHQSTTGTAGETGTGLGLLLCHDLVRQHNGTLTVESAVGVGTTFRFALPLADAAARPAAEHLPPASPAAPVCLSAMETAPHLAEAVLAPPFNVLRELLDMAQIGDIFGIEHAARQLLAQDARYAPAATHLLLLRQNLHIEQIRELLEQWLASADSLA